VASIADDLQRVPLFSGLNRRQLKRVASGFKEKEYAPGRTVVREGHMDGIGLFIVADGTAEVHVGGKRVGTLQPGDHFGELSVINRAERSATVIAETPLRCLMIAFWDFRKLATAHPDVLWKLLEQLAGVLAAERARRELAEAQDL
jgi:CRP-like cAMP-binding protein